MTAPRRTRQGERGQILAIVAGGITALLLLAGLVLDGGIAFFNRRDAQNLADTAALAGTRIVQEHYMNPDTTNDDQGDVYNVIQASLTNNGCAAAGAVPCSWTANFVRGGTTGPITNGAVTTSGAIPNLTQGVQVYVNRQPGAFLVRLAGISSWNITAEAMGYVRSSGVGPPGKLIPIALKQDTTAGSYNPGQQYDLTDGKDAPGGFGYLSWDGSNSSGALADAICTPNNPPFTMPTSFPADPGKTNSSDVRACLDKWISSGETVLIPIYDTVTGTGNNAVYHIVGLAAFVITSHDQPAVDNIQGNFVEIYPYSDVPAGVGTSIPGSNDTTAFLTLIK